MRSIEKFCSANMRPSAAICEKGGSTKKRTAQENIGKTQANPVSNSEQNANREYELYRESVSERERIFTRYLNENGYYFLQARKKGMLNEKDKKQRFKYAKQMRRQLQLYLVIPTSGKRSAYEPSGPLGRSLSRFP